MASPTTSASASAEPAAAWSAATGRRPGRPDRHFVSAAEGRAVMVPTTAAERYQ
ncbi:MAG: aminotransferase, partial [Stenotrophomonas sp.]|nr:aminotransferase [Stenotrophomonas sp.]